MCSHILIRRIIKKKYNEMLTLMNHIIHDVDIFENSFNLGSKGSKNKNHIKFSILIYDIIKFLQRVRLGREDRTIGKREHLLYLDFLTF